jgi:hypothetical protein
MLNPERVGLDALLSNLTVSVELEKFLQTLCRVGDSSNIPNDILLDVANSSISTFYDSFNIIFHNIYIHALYSYIITTY